MPADEDIRPEKKIRAKLSRKPFRIAGFLLICIVFVLAAYVGYLYAASPAAIRKPEFQHLHFRMQVLVDGKAVDFGQEKFQVPLGQDACAVALTEQPIHFHDGKDQLVHIHWNDITGGLVLKHYGWDYIGGINNTLGYRFDNLPRLQKVPIKGNLLPTPHQDAELFVYSGDEAEYEERSLDDFLKKDVETFFGKKSNLPGEQTSFLGRLFPTAYAHGSEDHGDAELQELNNLIGNVVIFAQTERPSDEQVEDRFRKLEPLSESVCAG